MPLTRAHPTPESPYFAPTDIQALATFFATGFFQHWHLYVAVLTQPRPVVEEVMTALVEVPFMPAFDGVALPGVSPCPLPHGLLTTRTYAHKPPMRTSSEVRAEASVCRSVRLQTSALCVFVTTKTRW